MTYRLAEHYTADSAVLLTVKRTYTIDEFAQEAPSSSFYEAAFLDRLPDTQAFVGVTALSGEHPTDRNPYPLSRTLGSAWAIQHQVGSRTERLRAAMAGRPLKPEIFIGRFSLSDKLEFMHGVHLALFKTLLEPFALANADKQPVALHLPQGEVFTHRVPEELPGFYNLSRYEHRYDRSGNKAGAAKLVHYASQTGYTPSVPATQVRYDGNVRDILEAIAHAFNPQPYYEVVEKHER